MSGQSFGGATVTDAGGGWWRISLTGTLPQSGAAAVISILDAGSPSFAGDGASGVLVWGPQLGQGLDLRPFAPTRSQVAGPVIFNPPAVLTPGGVQMWAAVCGGASWGGANVWVSSDDSTYEQVGVIDAPARFGALTAGFPSGADPDVANTCSVDLSASADAVSATKGALESASEAAANAAGTLSLILPSPGASETPELIAYETATPTLGGNRFDLTSYIRRGVENTPIGAHGAGAAFVRLDQAVFDFPYLATQAGVPVYVKFQSFNLWGQSPTPLSDCIAYQAVPVPLGVRPPISAAWTATPTTISNAGAATPAILITGHSDNLSAGAIEFFYRQTGTPAWISAGTASNSATQFTIAPVAANQTYDVAVAYIVNGVLGQLQIITPGGGSTTPSGGSGGAPGTVLLSDSAPGAAKTFTIPASFTGAHVDVVLTGLAGSGAFVSSGKPSFSFADYGGGGGGVVIAKGFPAAAGDVFTYTLPGAIGADATVGKTGFGLTAHSGANAGPGAPGAGAAASTGNTATGAASLSSYAGHNGGLTDAWDGGGPGATIDVPSGTVTAPGTDNTSDGSAGIIPGQGGAGSAFQGAQSGGGCNLLIIARS